ncbi:MAG: hypothetical protein PHV05_04825 [Candidatus Riflebacteria bacterium]|nr:hypothetical protein [Candidatus Riflebacteria bacterium]
MKKYKAKRLMQNGFRETLLVKRSKDGLYRIYARIGNRSRQYRPLSRSWLTETGAQTCLDDYAKENKLEPLGTAVLD